MMMADRFSFHCLVIVFSAALNYLDYYESLNSGHKKARMATRLNHTALTLSRNKRL
jgi:hypothetical protein